MIREYRQSDRDQLMGLWKLFDMVHIAAMPEEFHEPSEAQRALRHDKYTAESVRSRGRRYFMFISEEGGTVNGFVCGEIRETPDAALLIPFVIVELHAVYVMKGFRKGRISEELVNHAILNGKTHGAEKVVCHIWNFNAAAKKHVERLGFKGVSVKYEKTI